MLSVQICKKSHSKKPEILRVTLVFNILRPDLPRFSIWILNQLAHSSVATALPFCSAGQYKGSTEHLTTPHQEVSQKKLCWNS